MIMIYMWMKRNLNLLSRSMLRFIDFAICRAIVYFIACFFARDEDDRSTSNLVYHSSLVNSKKDKDSRNHMSEEKAASSPCLEKERFDLDSIHIDKDTRDELFLRREYCNEDIRLLNDRTPAITPCSSRPIIGSVASHWDENEQTEISHKGWGGNGIPNTTTKYKEDQKVSWHATPFKVRLDKALSEEGGQGVFPRRKLEVMEEDEGDSDISHLHHLVQPNSVASF